MKSIILTTNPCGTQEVFATLKDFCQIHKIDSYVYKKLVKKSMPFEYYSIKFDRKIITRFNKYL